MRIATGRRDDGPIYRPGYMASGTERERKTKTAAKKKFIAERQGKRRRGEEGGSGEIDQTRQRGSAEEVHATDHMWRIEGNRRFVLLLIYGPIRFCPKSGRTDGRLIRSRDRVHSSSWLALAKTSHLRDMEGERGGRKDEHKTRFRVVMGK